MKPSPFTYTAPRSLEDAVIALAEAGHDGKVLAGGQSLLPLLSMRLAAPGRLIDINRLDELAYVRVAPDAVHVGALARHAEVERHEAAYEAQPLLRQALRQVAHPTIRNRGTTVGSIAHADPSGEMTAVLTLLGGTVEAVSSHGRRDIAAADFFVGPLETSLQVGEMVQAVRFPRRRAATGTSFLESARRHGDYALVGVASLVELDDDLRIRAARAAYISVAPTPALLDLTEALAGATYDAGDWAAAGALAAARTEPEPDIHASADYRSRLVEVLTARGLAEAARHAAGLSTEGAL
ncbi:MAG TPA: xanthine dehydrogenase family protein subunit M [Actinomycetes bacterium]|nr:xanthine dehydrogenase family protein subunit M [Actinomycetes bacterium]